MAGGGLMQLVSYGAQDIYMTGMPEITYFRATYRRYNSFGNRIHDEQIKKMKNKETRNINILMAKKYKNLLDSHNKYHQSECVICLENFKKEEYVIVRKCRHIYHQECDNKAIIHCPVCRQ